MESLLQDVNWLAVIVGAVASFSLGYFWYSKNFFGKKWASGSGIDMENDSGMGMAMVAQAGATLLLAWVIGLTETMNMLPFAILITLTVAGFVKTNGLFSQKSNYAIAVDVGYIIAMSAVMVATHAVL